MIVLRRAGFATRGWLNGGGVTHDVAAAPDGAWQVSLAEIARPGPFSDYAGHDRTLTPIGAGLRLNGAPVGPAPHRFRGEDAVAATLDAGPVLAFNVITRRGAWDHAVRRRRDGGTVAAALVFVADGRLRLGDAVLERHDAALLEGTAAEALSDPAAEWIEVTLMRG